MNLEQRSPQEDELDQLVRTHLEQLAQQTDSSSLVERICRGASQSEQVVVTGGALGPRWFRPLAWSLVTAVAICAAFLSGRSWPLSRADAATVLQEVHRAHLQPVDRCYQVTFAPDPEYAKAGNPFRGRSDTTLWTRGERFWADARLGAIRLVYGRDEQGKLWVSPSRSRGIQLVSDDGVLPEEIAMYCAINSMSMPALVEKVLRDFDLRADGPAAPSADNELFPIRTGRGSSVVWATLKQGHTHPFISSALLEVDEHDTLVRLILWTIEDGRPRGTVTLNLVETARIGDDQYSLDFHLDPDAEVQVHQFETPDGLPESE
jgi:hypothetical protein